MDDDMNEQQLTRAQRDEFEQLVAERVKAITGALPGRQPTFVVLEALMRVHRLTVSHLDNESKGYAAMALGEYAGELLRASAAPLTNVVHH